MLITFTLSDPSLKGSVVNQVWPSFNGGSHEMKLLLYLFKLNLFLIIYDTTLFTLMKRDLEFVYLFNM